MYRNYNNDDRFFFPFLTGAVIGGAAVGLTRPRPVFVTGGYNPYYGAPYGYSSYNYYYPRYY